MLPPPTLQRRHQAAGDDEEAQGGPHGQPSQEDDAGEAEGGLGLASQPHILLLVDAACRQGAREQRRQDGRRLCAC